MSHLLRTAVGGCALAAIALGAPHVRAQATESFPSKPFRIIVPFPPGGGTDILARLVGQQMTESMGQPAVVDNRGGAGGMIGTELAMKAPADGHTILVAVTAYTINPSLYRKVNYDPLRDFSAVTLGISFPYLFVVHPSLPVKTVKEFIALAKAQPGKITFASSGTGNSNHLAGELFKDLANIDMVHVPYKGGGPAMNDILGGQVSMIFGTVLQTLPQVRAGKLRALAVSSAKRASFAPELPTIAEAALPEFEATGWYAFMVPAGTPAPAITRLNREITRILDQPAVKEKLLAMGAEPWPTTPEKARDFIAAEVARWSRVINKVGLKGSA
ncbi:MAG: tripartite tricarboxylate transporter substrate binding protein [Burkholderiales bacterium]|nr:tripartite tricarboxylate transporter substrate binding protein [Burkholderiales bacterium]